MDGKQLGRLKLQVQFHHVRSPRRSRTSESSPTLPVRRSSIQQAIDVGFHTNKSALTVQTAVEGPLESAVATMTLESTTTSTMEASERDRLHAAIQLIDPSRAAEVTELILSLSDRERALCLFNYDYLQRKIKEAVRVLDAAESTGATPRTLDELAQLPLARIHSLLQQAAVVSELGLTPPSDESIECVNGWIAELEKLDESARKQRIGEKVFALLKVSDNASR
jgi:hypothetical protein